MTSDGVSLATLTGHNKPIESSKFSPNGNYVVSGSADRLLKVWDTSTFECILTFLGHNDIVFETIFNKFDELIFSFSDDMIIKVWDLKKKHCIKTIGSECV
jgi:WD40 repeat protein